VSDPAGRERTTRMPAAAYLQLVAATNFKQRCRKTIEYYHADRLGFAVAGTPNRLEHMLGFFVKQGDGAADLKPIAHLYKSQVYALAEHLEVPLQIRSREPSTETFSLPQSQEEFYFRLPYREMDLCLWASDNHLAAAEVAAVLGLSAAQIEEIEAMVAALRHRGPDEFGFFRDRRAGLGHARLSILDLETGQQPLCNEDSSLWIVFNGEIFNYIELRRDLEQRGHRFATKSDTEVIVHAWEEWGEACFERFNGQWALALWDSRKERLVLARDRMGILPLHYCEHAGRVLFASEIKAIFAADATIPRALDPVGIDEVFTFW